ncbi:MAG: FprA family A-type flavoprotein [Lentisphaerae bacterium]|nr:FprA family A-type flavoprotein [Lentisphaerota bacterium]
MNSTLVEGIDWVGYVDWTVRDFHGYRTERGSTYNAYLVRDEKTALVDTVKANYAENLVANITALTEPRKIDFVVCNHAEPDHSGSLPVIMRLCPNAELVCDARCREALSLHYDTSEWNFRVIADGDTLSLGKRTLTFLETPMVHWPESMFTYVAEEKLLFSMDAFGQHYASAHRFDDMSPLETVLEEAKTYYANIVMLYGKPIGRVLDRADALDVEIIAPSHGVIWRKNIATILAAYRRWVEQRPAAKVIVLFDTMWRSTEIMARAILEGAAEDGVSVLLMHARENHKTEIVTEALDAAAFAVGSPTLNTTLMPDMAGVLTYMKGLKPVGKCGFAFGSYGWSKGGAAHVEAYLKDMRMDILREPIQAQFVPDAAVLEECRNAGRMLAAKARELSGQDAKTVESV